MGKTNKNYIQHDLNARSDIKILNLRSDFGMQGYGVFWALLEMLYEANNYELPVNYKALALDLKVKATLVQAVVEKYDLFVVADGKFYSKSLKNRICKMEEVSKKLSDAGIKGMTSRGNKEHQTQMPTTSTDKNATRQRRNLAKSFGANALTDSTNGV